MMLLVVLKRVDDRNSELENIIKLSNENKEKVPIPLPLPVKKTPKKVSKTIEGVIGIIIDDFHKTSPFLTKYEKTKILGQRARQINIGAKPFIKVDRNVVDGILIAQMELEKKKIPFIIRRPIPDGGSEYWKLRDLEILE